MIDIFGWWAFDPDNEALVNTLSGERVRFVAKLSAKEAPTEGEWLRFEYEHEGLSYPLLVETGSIVYDTFERYTRQQTLVNDNLAWQVDHIRSAQLWCEEQGSDTPYPSYGLWRRVDDCVCDALTFWPQREKTGLSPTRILVAGGWVNGSWSDLWERTFPYGTKAYKPSPLKCAWLFPLDEPAPSPWVFHDYKETGAEVDISMMAFEGLKRYPAQDVTLKNKSDRFYYIPAEQRLTGFENKTVYLQTKDKSSAISLNSIDCIGHSAHGGPPKFTFLYGDSQLTTNFSARNLQVEAYGDWEVTNISSYVGLKPRLVEGNITPAAEAIVKSTARPSLEIWQKTATSIRDALLQFEGSHYRFSDWHDVLILSTSDNVFSADSYRGGVWISGPYCSSRYLDKPQTLHNRINLNEQT